MAFFIWCNGFFKPNISSLVGTLYDNNDPRKDSAFSLFYMGINIGAAIGGLLCGYVGQRINWHYGFGLAGIFMVIGLIVFGIGQKSLLQKGLPPDPVALKKARFGLLSNEHLIYLSTFCVLPLVVLLFNHYEAMDYIMFSLGAASLLYILTIAMKLEKEARHKLFAALVMIIFSVLFWAFYEQNSGSLNLFAMRNVDMKVGGVDLPPLSVNNFLPPAWVIILSFFFAWLWPWLNKRKREPSTPLKFALSFIFMGIRFWVLNLCCTLTTTGLVSLTSFVLGYMFIICGEMCISPIGLSMITKLSPMKIVSMMMGIWFFASAIGEFLAAKIGSMISLPAEIAERGTATESLPCYSIILNNIGIGSIAIGFVLIIFVPLLRKWMHDVR